MKRMTKLFTALALALGLTTAASAETRIVSYSVAQCWNGSTTGALTGESYNTMEGTIPLAAWSQPLTDAPDVELISGGYGSILTISKYWDGTEAKTFTDVSNFKIEARITGGTNLYGPNGSPTSFDDYRTAVNQALNCNGADNTITVSGIPFACYDVIVYFAGGNKKGTNYAMNSVKVNNGNYYYPKSTTAGDNDISSSQKTWGDSTSSDLVYGTNVMCINSLMSSSLTLKQTCSAYGIAAIQIIERENPYTGVTSMNFGSNKQAVTAGTDPGGIVADKNWVNISGGSGTDVAAGSYSVTFDAAGTWSGDASQQHLKGYLDENNGGSPYPINITIKNVESRSYDVYIYCESDNASGWSYKTVNGVNYYADATGKAVVGTSDWGANGTVSVLGTNVMRVENVYPDADGNITIKSERNGGKRGCIAAVQVCAKPAAPTYVATINVNTNWEDIVWAPSKPTEGFEEDAVLKLTVAENLTLTFNEIINAPQRLEISGEGVPTLKSADELFEDGCWEKTMVAFGSFVPGLATVSETLPTGFSGAYTLTDSGFKVRAQNREVISINVAGGSIIPGGSYEPQPSPKENMVTNDAIYYGVAPTLGSTWNNIDGKWKNYRTTVTLEGSIASAPDGTVTNRPTIDLSATAGTTWQADITNPFLRGYLDDGGGVQVAVHGIPYTKYDVIVYVTSDSADIKLAPVTINGTTYTYVNGELVEGNTAWGKALCNVPAIGDNAIYIKDCEGELLTIDAQRVNQGKAGDGRGTVCAVQVINQGDILVRSEYFGEMDGDVVWTDGKTAGNLTQLGDDWVNGQLSTITITNMAEDATFSFGAETIGQQIKFVSDYPITIDAASMVEYGKLGVYDFTEVEGGATLQLPEEDAFDATKLPTIKGDWKFSKTGVLVFDGKYPTAAEQTFFTNEVDWAGTVWIKNVTVGGEVFNNYGNANSKLRFTGVKGWFNYNTNETTLPIELVDEGETRALEVTDGSLNKAYIFDKITGEGTINVSSVHKDAFIVQIKDVSEFTGKITSLDSTTPFGDETKAFPILVGEMESALPYGTTSKITVADGATIYAPAEWEAKSAAFGATLTVKNAEVGNTIISGLTMEDPVYLGAKVTLEDQQGFYCLGYDAEDGEITICETTQFDISACNNATITVLGAFLDGDHYYAAENAQVKVTYTADDGYIFPTTLSKTLVVDATVTGGMEPIEATEEPVADAPFVYNEGWTWNGDPVEADFVSNHTAIAIEVQSDLEWPIDRSTFTVAGGTLTATKTGTATITVNKYATFDANGQYDGYFTFILNGGSLVNNGGEMGTGKRQIEGITLTAHSTVGGTGTFGMSSNSHHANVLDLGGYTLTKEGENTFFLINTTVTNGTVSVTNGTLQIYESATTFVEADLTLYEDATLKVDSTLNIDAIEGKGGTINNAGTITPFILTGEATLTGNGTWGTNTLDGATVNVGTKHDFVFAGAGWVNAVLTAAEIAQEGPITIFEVEEGLTSITGNKVYDEAGKEVPGNWAGGSFQVDHEAKIGDVYYLTLQDALNVGGDVTVLKDITLEKGLDIGDPEGYAKTVNLDLNAKTITAQYETTKKAYDPAINIISNAVVTIKGNGTITGWTGSAAAALDGKSIIAVDGAQLYFENGTLTAGGEGSDGLYGICVKNDGLVRLGVKDEGGPTIETWFAAVGSNNLTPGDLGVTVTIYDGTYTQLADGTDQTWHYFCAPVYAPANGTYTILGGTFNGALYSISAPYANAAQSIALDGGTFNQPLYASETQGAGEGTRVITKDDGVEIDPPAGYLWNEGVLTKAAARIGTNYYLTLKEAVGAAVGGDTVTLLQDVAAGEGIFIEGFLSNLTIDFGGHTYTLAGMPVGSTGYETQGFHIEAANCTLTNGTINCSEENRDKTWAEGAALAEKGIAMLVQNYSSLTVADMTLDGTNLAKAYYGKGEARKPGANYTLSNCSGTTTIAGSTISARDGESFAFDSDKTAVVTLASGTINGKIEVYATLTIDGGTINGPANGKDFDGKAVITVNGGTLAFNAGTLKATGVGDSGMYGVYVLNGGKATFGIEGQGGPSIEAWFAAIGANNTTSPCTITVNDGTYTQKADGTDQWWHYFCAAIYAPAAGTYTINGGTFDGALYCVASRYVDAAQTITFNGGTFSDPLYVDEQPGATTGERTITKLASITLDVLPADTYKWSSIPSTNYEKLVKDDGPSVDPTQGSVIVDESTKTVVIVPGEDVKDVTITGAEGYTVEVPGTVNTVTGVTAEQVDVVMIVEPTTGVYVDISDAFKAVQLPVTGAPQVAIVLDPDATVTIGTETIPVTPTAIEPEEGGTIAEGEVATASIPGLTYKLMRGTELGTYDVTADSEKATSTTVTLTDADKPADKAFYVIEVTK